MLFGRGQKAWALWALLVMACGQASKDGAGGASGVIGSVDLDGGVGGIGGQGNPRGGSGGVALSGSGGVAVSGTSGGAGGAAANDGPCGPDADHDGLSDLVEGRLDSNPQLSRDTDLDLTPDYLDLDSDGDGLPDAQERGEGLCSMRDTDSDGLPDFQDDDADNDGIRDADEVAEGTDPTRSDSDGDGCPDIVEKVAGDCESKQYLVLAPRCDSDVATAAVVLKVSDATTGELNGVRLSVDAEPPDALASFTAAITSVNPAAGAMLASGVLDHLLPGTVVTVGLSVQPARPGTMARIALLSASLGSLSEQHVFIVPGMSNCVYPK
ncbi:MAG: hypothetical protein QM756_02945 [Polyangiaceae bacterium]